MPSVTLNTKEFSKMLTRAGKASVKGGVDMLAELVEIKLKSGVLSVRTTDTRNTLILRKDGISGDDFTAVIGIELFEKLVSKTSTETLTLKITDSYVELIGNGSYKFALTIEGDQPVTLPPIPLIPDPEFKSELKLSAVRSVINFNGDFVGSAFVDPSISGFYFGDKAVTTDSTVCCFYSEKLFPSTTMIYPSTLALLGEFEDESVTVLKKGKHVQMYSNKSFIDTVEHVDVSDFPLAELSSYLDNAYDSSVEVSKKITKDVIERVSFFVDQKTEFGATYFDFRNDGIHVSDRNGHANEVIPYKSVDMGKFRPFKCLVPAPDLSKVLDIEGADYVTLRYDSGSAIRVDDGNNTRILALLNESDISDSVQYAESTSEDTEIGELPSEFLSSDESSEDEVVW